MLTINFEGASLHKVEVMKISGLGRATIEFNLNDSERIMGDLMDMLVKKFGLNGSFTFTEREGENNGYEEQFDQMMGNPMEAIDHVNTTNEHRI